MGGWGFGVGRLVLVLVLNFECYGFDGIEYICNM